jgi:hypothetical protein
LIDENFEGAGYEETWVETVGGSSTVDEDDTSTPGTPLAGSGSHCLKCEVTSTDTDAKTRNTLSGNEDIVYASVDFYATAEDFDEGEGCYILLIGDALAANVCDIQWYQSSGLKFRLQYYSGGSINSTAGVAMSLNTWYRLEFRYDITNTAWSWYIDESLQDSGVLAAAMRTPRFMTIGIAGHSTHNGTTTAYFDQAHWNTERYMGFAYNRMRRLYTFEGL